MSGCGTQAGARAHNRAGEPLCDACRAIERERARQYRTRKRLGMQDMNPAQKAAPAKLMDANGYNTRPCKDPKRWDIQPMSGRSPDAAVKARKRICDTRCPVSTFCEAYAATNPPVNGVLAGRVIEGQEATA